MSKKLRPHHGMCFQFYEGKGYSKDFTDHMGMVIREMETDSSQKVKLRVSTDIVCANCPNNESGCCTSQEKVVRYDNEVLRLCEIKEGEELSYADFLQRVKERIIDTGLRKKVCGDCSWDYICREKSVQ